MYNVNVSPSGAVEWRPRLYPVNLSLREYHVCKGLDEEGATGAMLRWGPNKYDIPMPTFNELFAEQLIAPMFIFQVCPHRTHSHVPMIDPSSSFFGDCK